MRACFANFLSGLVGDYYARHATLADSTTVDFSEEDRDLIVAFAAERATYETWFSGGQVGQQTIARKLDFEKKQAWSRARYTNEPKRTRPRRMVGRFY